MKRDDAGGGSVRRRTCVPDGASLFGDGDHYSIRFHFGLEEKRRDDMPLVGGVGRFFQRPGKVRNSTVFRTAVRPRTARARVSKSENLCAGQFSRAISLCSVMCSQFLILIYIYISLARMRTQTHVHKARRRSSRSLRREYGTTIFEKTRQRTGQTFKSATTARRTV